MFPERINFSNTCPLLINADTHHAISFQLQTAAPAIPLPLESFLEAYHFKFRKCIPRLYLNQGAATKSPHLSRHPEFGKRKKPHGEKYGEQGERETTAIESSAWYTNYTNSIKHT
jgi:hypothetical protein